jgi:CSLREA domain-containing protein
MSPHWLRRTSLLIPLVLTVLAACRDTEVTAPRVVASKPQFAQGVGGVWTVNTLADPGDGACDDTNCTLREAVAAAAAGDQIVFQAGLQGTIALTNSFIEIPTDLSLDGGGRITIDGQNTSRVLAFDNNFGPLPRIVTLEGLTLKNGFDQNGGAMFVGYGTVVTIRNSTISGNTGTSGGGIWIGLNASVTLINSAMSGNRGLEFGGAIRNGGKLTLISTAIDSNRVDDIAGRHRRGAAHRRGRWRGADRGARNGRRLDSAHRRGRPRQPDDTPAAG